MKTSRDDMKSFWRGWKEAVNELLYGEARSYDHLLYLVSIPVYPLLWLAIYLWLPQGKQNDQNREDP